jgi:uncharacterized membrane protein
MMRKGYMKTGKISYTLPLPQTPHQRMGFIDALRGIAVLLMIAQHVSLWGCAQPRESLLIMGMLQNHFETPLRLYNSHMAAPVGVKGVARYALAEGYFPIFPWIAFFMTGLLAGRWLKENRMERARHLALWLLLATAILALTYFIGPDFARREPLVRYFRLQLSFYSALTPLSLLLMAVSLLLFIAFCRFDQTHGFGQSHVLVCLGRVSLTFLMIHIAVIRESALYFGYWQTLPKIGTLFATLTILACFALIAKVWQRYRYKFGFEWLLRRVSDRPDG